MADWILNRIGAAYARQCWGYYDARRMGEGRRAVIDRYLPST